MAKHHVHRRHEHAEAKADAQALQEAWEARNQLEARQAEVVQSTVYVYFTQAATFTGETAAFVTQTQGPTATTKASTTTPAAQKATTTTKASSVQSILVAVSSSKSSTNASGSLSAILPGTSTVPTTLAIAVATSSPAAISAVRTSSSPSASATSSSAASNETGMSTGSKVGIAVGVIIGIGALLSFFIFCFRRKKKAAQAERLQDEKSTGSDDSSTGAFARAASTRTARTASTAPRLSLRPVTQFSPNLSARQSQANALAMKPVTKDANLTPRSAWERPSTSASQDSMNPFGNHAAVDNYEAAGAPVVATGPGGPHSASPMAEAPSTEFPAVPLAAEMGGAAGAAVSANTIGLARGASKRENRPHQLEISSANMPPGGDAPGSAGGAAIAAAGGPQDSTVHRVQLDFKPSMEDELELKAGQLIRKLMDYDDGWCLCIRLDRSEQGVVPRTCLSNRPVKPRPNGPPPQTRGPPPQGYRGPPGPGMQNGPPRPHSAQSNRGPNPHYAQGPPRPGSAQSNRGPRYNQGPARPGSAQSNRGPHYNQGPSRPGSAQSTRSPQQHQQRFGPNPGFAPNPHFAQPLRPSSASSNHTVFPGAGYSQDQHNYNPSAQDLRRAESPAPLNVPGRDGNRSPPEQQGHQGHRARSSVDRKPVPGMAM